MQGKLGFTEVTKVTKKLTKEMPLGHGIAKKTKNVVIFLHNLFRSL